MITNCSLADCLPKINIVYRYVTPWLVTGTLYHVINITMGFWGYVSQSRSQPLLPISKYWYCRIFFEKFKGVFFFTLFNISVELKMSDLAVLERRAGRQIVRPYLHLSFCSYSLSSLIYCKKYYLHNKCFDGAKSFLIIQLTYLHGMIALFRILSLCFCEVTYCILVGIV